MGYANKTITREYPDFSEDDDPIWVKIRNPKLVSIDGLLPRDVPVDANGRPLDEKAAMGASYEVIARLVLDWHVYDNETDEELPLPATEELVRKLPADIVNDLVKQLAEVIAPPQ